MTHHSLLKLLSVGVICSILKLKVKQVKTTSGIVDTRWVVDGVPLVESNLNKGRS